MRILILTQHFPPEVTAGSTRLEQFARGLADRGHEVEVICAVPNHPEGVVQEGFRGRLVVRRHVEAYNVRYVWVRASPRKSGSNRLLLYGSYALTSSVFGMVARRPDLVFASSPPLPVAAAGMLVAKRHRVPWVMDCRDLWPEVAIALGAVTDARAIAVLEALERRLYRSAAAVITVTEAFRSTILAKAPPGKSVEIIANGTTREWMRTGEANPDRAGLGMPGDRFVVTYAGNVGLSQGLEHAVEAFADLGDRYQLQMVGTGPRLEALRGLAAALPAGRVVFRGLVTPERAAEYLRASDANLISLGADPGSAKVVPSKLYDCCAVGRPIVLAATGEGRRVAKQANVARVVEPEDSPGLAAAIRELSEDVELRDSLSASGRAFAARHLREDQIDGLDALLDEIAGSQGRGG